MVRGVALKNDQLGLDAWIDWLHDRVRRRLAVGGDGPDHGRDLQGHLARDDQIEEARRIPLPEDDLVPVETGLLSQFRQPVYLLRLELLEEGMAMYGLKNLFPHWLVLLWRPAPPRRGWLPPPR